MRQFIYIYIFLFESTMQLLKILGTISSDVFDITHQLAIQPVISMVYFLIIESPNFFQIWTPRAMGYVISSVLKQRKQKLTNNQKLNIKSSVKTLQAQKTDENPLFHPNFQIDISLTDRPILPLSPRLPPNQYFFLDFVLNWGQMFLHDTEYFKDRRHRELAWVGLFLKKSTWTTINPILPLRWPKMAV